MKLIGNNQFKKRISTCFSHGSGNKTTKWKTRSIVLSITLFILSVSSLKFPTIVNESSEEQMIPIGKDLYLSKDSGHIFKLVRGTIDDHIDLDPTDSWDSSSNDVIRQVVETLWTNNLTDPNLERINHLAESYNWQSDTQLRVTLRQGITFHDGAPFNATAAKWSLDRLVYLMNHTGQLPYGRDVADIHSLYEFPNGSAVFDRFDVVSDYELDIFLNAPYTQILDAMTYVACAMVSPKSTPGMDFIDPYSGDLVGTGPFVYDGCTLDKEVRFHAFDNYWQGRAKIDILVYNIISDAQPRNIAMLDGNIDYLSGAMTDLYDIFRVSPDITLYDDPNEIGLATHYLAMNNDHYTIADGDSDDAAIGLNITWRKAITWAINNTYLVKEIFDDTVTRAYCWVSKSFGDKFDPKLPTYNGTAPNDGNITHSRKIIKDGLSPVNADIAARDINNDADWQVDDEFDPDRIISFNYSYNWGNMLRENIYYALENWLSQIGIYVIDGGADWTYFIYRAYGYVPGGRDQLQLFWIGWGPDYFDAMNMIQPLISNISASNAAQVNHRWIEGNISLYNNDITLSYNERKWIIWNLTYICTNILYTHVFGAHPNITAVHSSKIYNVLYNPLNYFYAYSISLNLAINTPKIHITGINWSDAIIAGHCTGLGTYSDPYVIKDKVVDATGYGAGIFIENSNAHFRIENCTVLNSEGERTYYAGISLFNVSNGIIINNNCSLNKWSGISLCNSDNNTVTGNTADYNGHSGIDIDDSSYNNITHNMLNYNNESGLFSRGYCTYNNLYANTANYNNNSGIYLFTHFDFNTITKNTANHNNNSGIYFSTYHDNNTITKNYLSFNNNSGLYFFSVNRYNSIKRNTICNNTQYGIHLYDSTIENTITENIIANNSQIGLYIGDSYNPDNNIYSNVFLQNQKHARDEYDWGSGINSWNTSSVGNYWDNYTGLDTSPFDGIGDIPYGISGDTDNEDYFPIHQSPVLNETFIFINGSDSNTLNLSQIANVKWWCSGSGTYSDPCVIENLIFDGENSGSCIWIEGTKEYLEIRNCTVINSGSGIYDAGIKLVSASNISLINNNASISHKNGIYAWKCNNITITGNDLIKNDNTGVFLRNSNNSRIKDNTITNTGEIGIKLNPSSYNTISKNNISFNFDYGIFLDIDTINNVIYLNDFIQNTIHGCDNGSNNQWDNSSIGNFWDDYISKDVNDDGIGDTFYTNITGTAGSQDEFPIYWDPPIISLTSPSMYELFGPNPPQFSISMVEGVNDTIWYTLDNGIINTTSPTLTGTINQIIWGNIPNGTATIFFNVNDSRGFKDSTSVIVRKDIIIPTIIIYSPVQNDIYRTDPPTYSVRIFDPNGIDRMWYSIVGDPSTLTFTSNGSISQSLWNIANEGTVTIIFYASDIAGNVANASVDVTKSFAYRMLSPLIIDDIGAGDYTWEEVASQNWCSGLGTSSNPYIIESLLISGQNTGTCIEIRNSNVYFIIQNSIFAYSGSSMYDAGIKLYNVANGILDNNNCSLNDNFGIILMDCSDITIQNSDINDNDIGGVYLLNSDNNSIINNGETIKDNGLYGIKLDYSLNNIISGNYISNNYYGIFIFRSNNTIVDENFLIKNNEAIEEQESEDNDIGEDNTIQDIGGGPPIPIELIIFIVIISAVVVLGVTGALVWKKKIASKGIKEKEKISYKKAEKMKDKLHTKLKFVDHLIKENKLNLAYKNLGKIKDSADGYEFFDIFNQANEKIQICKDIEAGVHIEPKIEEEPVFLEEKVEKPIITPIITTDIEEEKGEEYNVFLSYSTLDSDYFEIPRIVTSLEEFPDITRVLYWEADSKQNIVEFMDETLKKCNVFILFVSNRSMKSAAVKDEWQAAFQKRKRELLKFIPVYEDEDDIPTILGHLLNVKFEKSNFQNFIERLHREIQR